MLYKEIWMNVCVNSECHLNGQCQVNDSSVIWGPLAQMGSGFFQILNHLKTLKYH